MSVFDTHTNLLAYWHVIALSRELPPESAFRRTLYDVPLLIWRGNNGQPYAVLDMCAHKKAPLQVFDFAENQLICPYHGWKYAHDGELLEIPSSPHLVEKMKCRLPAYPIREQDGLIWIYLQDEVPEEELPPIESMVAVAGKEWKHWYTSMVFETTDELLIENFMDATHTPLVHDGLIRSQKTPTEHEITITQLADRIRVAFAETNEQVGIGLRWMLGRRLSVVHTDEFVLPNLVRVDYILNQADRFHAFIACTPLTPNTTQAFVRLSFRFGWLNRPISWVLPRLARKVLRQDFQITQQQWQNRQIFESIADSPIDYDSVYTKIRRLRQNPATATDAATQTTVKKIRLRL
jgi:phenylpropionate dioxygenase-like ring-hydroxylating dioxygenase large terminal subunit